MILEVVLVVPDGVAVVDEVGDTQGGDTGGEVLRPVFVAPGDTFLAFGRLDVHHIVLVEVIVGRVEYFARGEVDGVDDVDALFGADDGDAVAQAVHGDVAAYGQRLEYGETGFGHVDLLRFGHFTDHGDAEVHEADGDLRVFHIASGHEAPFDVGGQLVEGHASGVDAAEDGEDDVAFVGHMISADFGLGDHCRLVGLLIEGDDGLRCLAVDVDIELVVGQDGAGVVGGDGHLLVARGVADIAVFAGAARDQQQERQDDGGDSCVFHVAYFLTHGMVGSSTLLNAEKRLLDEGLSLP